MVLGILGLAAMILCWAAGSYWKKVYYLIWFLSLPMPIFWFLYSFSMDEDGDGGSSGGIEAVLTVIILIILVIIYVKARNLGDVINTIARYVLELLCITGGTAYGKKKEPESNCKEDQKNGNYTDSEQEVQRYGVPDAVFGS